MKRTKVRDARLVTLIDFIMDDLLDEIKTHNRNSVDRYAISVATAALRDVRLLALARQRKPFRRTLRKT